mmetsp:Transcript_11470/g.13028  ORF Transcript_11470/g.13028 Transcript_11470/m.13028 type:complete len:226 (+) Transcript_11470:372-1049(+)
MRNCLFLIKYFIIFLLLNLTFFRRKIPFPKSLLAFKILHNIYNHSVRAPPFINNLRLILLNLQSRKRNRLSRFRFYQISISLKRCRNLHSFTLKSNRLFPRLALSRLLSILPARSLLRALWLTKISKSHLLWLRQSIPFTLRLCLQPQTNILMGADPVSSELPPAAFTSVEPLRISDAVLPAFHCGKSVDLPLAFNFMMRRNGLADLLVPGQLRSEDLLPAVRAF